MQNWKTTVAALIAALIISLETIANALQTGAPLNWWQIGLSFAIAALGIFARDIKPKVKTVKDTTLMSITLLVLITGCASTKTTLVSGTLSNGDKFPLCLEVTQQSPIGDITLIAAFCANVQADINNKAAQYRTMYGPNVKITELIGPEKRTLN